MIKVRPLWLTVAVILLFTAYFLKSTLIPFLVSALLAYVGNPAVEKMEKWRIPRALGVSLVFTAFLGLVLFFALVLLPPFERQLGVLVRQLPQGIKILDSYLHAALGHRIPAGHKFDISSAIAFFGKHLSDLNFTSIIMTSISSSGMVIFEVGFYLVLVPVLTFYLMRDWASILRGVESLVPRWALADVKEAARMVDVRLGGFMFGQLLVMVTLAGYYMLALWLVGLKSALLIGLIAGFINFVPYLGFFVGLLLAGISLLAEGPTVGLLIGVVIVFVLGKILEDVILEPVLVGDRVGLHPVGIIFAIFAGGQILGFWGILLAVPAAALFVGLAAFARKRWLSSDLYQHKSESS